MPEVLPVERCVVSLSCLLARQGNYVFVVLKLRLTLYVILMFLCVLQGQGMVFMETSFNFQQHRHAFIECVPLEMDPYRDCALFFKKVRPLS